MVTITFLKCDRCGDEATKAGIGIGSVHNTQIVVGSQIDTQMDLCDHCLKAIITAIKTSPPKSMER